MQLTLTDYAEAYTICLDCHRPFRSGRGFQRHLPRCES
jgi:hypothetical protein